MDGKGLFNINNLRFAWIISESGCITMHADEKSFSNSLGKRRVTVVEAELKIFRLHTSMLKLC